jgi:hypothetical protein
VDASPLLEGLIAQARPAHGSLTGPIRMAAAALKSSAAAPGSSSSSSGDAASGAADVPPTTLVLRAVGDEQAQVGDTQRLLSRCLVGRIINVCMAVRNCLAWHLLGLLLASTKVGEAVRL